MSEDKEVTFHGGFVRNRGQGRGVRVARAKVSELPTVADPQSAQERVSAMERAGTYGKAIAPLKARKTKLAVLGIPSHILDKGSQEYARCVRMANSYKKARIKELYQAHGYVSSGVSALIAAAALALSGSRYIYEACSESVLTNPNLLKLASSLGDSARQNELSAWELCAREAVVRKRNEANNLAMPWVVTERASSSGEQKRGPGRPRTVKLLEEESTSARTEPEHSSQSITEAEGSSESN